MDFSEALCGCRKLFAFVAVDGFDEIVASWEVAIESGVADAGSACDRNAEACLQVRSVPGYVISGTAPAL